MGKALSSGMKIASFALAPALMALIVFDHGNSRIYTFHRDENFCFRDWPWLCLHGDLDENAC